MGCASAQVREKAQDRKALREDNREKRDDQRDVLALDNLLLRFDAARARNDGPALMGITRELKNRVEREVVETKVELGKDGKELRQDRREVGRDGTRDDWRDLRDDRRDARVEAGSLVRVKAINQELAGLVDRVDPASLDHTRALITELMRMGWNELGQDRREKREDHRELTEDRRN